MFVISHLHRWSRVSLALLFLPLCSISLLLLLVASLAAGEAAQVKPAVAYTGKTYGYLRNNEQNNPTGPLANDFVATYRNIRKLYPQAILVGTGDNFAPEYLARYVRQNGVDTPVDRKGADSPAVSFFKSFDHTYGPGEKLLDVGYDALVPGQLDFYFGADFLWQVGNGANAPLSMLASNLVIQNTKQPVTPQPLCAQPQLLLPTQVSLPLQSSSGSGSGKGKGGAGKKSGGGSGGGSGQGSSTSSSGQGGQSGQLCLQERTADAASGKGLTLVTPSPGSVYPWVTEFEFSLPDGSTIGTDDPLLCRWLANPAKSNPDCTELKHPIPLGPNYLAEVKDSDLAIAGPEPDHPEKDGTLLHSHILNSGAVVKLCVATTAPKTSFACTSSPILIQNAFFDRGWKTVERSSDSKNENIKYAVFAALDPAIEGLISPENSSWGDNKQYTAQINILDPAPALSQLMTAFQRLHKGQWTYVLLAQMQRAPAQALAASLRWQQQHVHKDLRGNPKYNYRFQVIISAADYDEATPEVNLTLHSDPGAQPPSTGNALTPEPPPTPVMTPHPIVTADVMRDPLAVVEIDDSQHGTTTYDNCNFPLAQTGHWNDKCASYDTMSDALNNAAFNQIAAFARSTTAHLRTTADDSCSLKSAFQCLALKTMRDQLEADAAMLQKRDFYSACNYEGPTQSSVQAWTKNPSSIPWNELVQRVLWNSGYLTRASVSGATLKAVLQASENISKLEQSSTNEPIERNRDLVYVGITKSSGLYYIDGAAVEDSKIYSIATSDQLALGDPAYAQFAQPDLVVPTVFTAYDKKTFAIADLAASPFLHPGWGHSELRDSRISVTRAQVVALLPSSITVPDPFNPPKPKGPPPDPFKDKPVVKAFQNRPVLSITLQQASVGYTDSRPNQTDTSIGTNLSGVNNPNVLAPHSDSLSVSDQLRVLWPVQALLELRF